MRRPVMYLAGLLLASGASLALAGPAQAAVSHDNGASKSSHYWCDEDDYYGYSHHHRRHHHRHGGGYDFYYGDSYTINNGILNGNRIGIDIF
ncbi:hypothetical protein [Paractinoplanes lichenicola]|uniref:Uncharacterized protein n=1 Tax=Paractinoplanes lichenicola TaxID=2802976 RepID=A0ABS1VX52_9ACTN|nr:hypothetical protein [Actinoplanes lichenicola]MBL7259067.1 hypothetical protein [Actinoplanes lichenicola]